MNMSNRSTKWTLPLITSLVLGALALDTNAEEIHAYWQDQNGDYIRSGTGSCVRTGNWTPELANAECDPDLVPRQVSTAPPAEVSDSQPASAEPAAPAESVAAALPAAAAPVEKTIVTAETLFDTDRSDIKPSGKATLDELIAQLHDSDSVIIPVVGYASSTGTEEHNLQLSERRAQAVKNYLVSQGIDSDRIDVASRGEQDPVADNSTAQGRALNQRVEIEVKGTPPPQE